MRAHDNIRRSDTRVAIYVFAWDLGDYWRTTLLLATAPADAIRDLGLCVYRRVRNHCAVEGLRIGRKNLRAMSLGGESGGEHRTRHTS
jgi:hypothetical protein